MQTHSFKTLIYKKNLIIKIEGHQRADSYETELS